MSNGIPLDTYLNGLGSPGGLTEQEIQEQLFPDVQLPAKSSPQAPAAGTTKPQPKPETDPLADLENRMAGIRTNSADDSDTDFVDSAIKSASHGVKVLAPLLAAATRLVRPEDDSSKIEDMMAKILMRLQSDTELVIQAYGVDPAEAPNWLTSQVSGQIIEVLISAIERNNGAVLDSTDVRYLKPLIHFAKDASGIGANFYKMPSDPDLQIANSLMMATSAVMTEYHSFNYFLPDAAMVAQQVSDFLNERVIEGTLETLTSNFSLNGKERSYLAASLLKQAGNILCNAWADNVAPAMSALGAMEVEERRSALIGGCSIEPVFEDFENQYQALEMAAQSAIQTRAPHREVQYQNDLSPKY
jgi:hypothetical protein|tara:strand:+ start:22186 stop:23262 length:1077 start_codon:yes stop_codon:yes gene_type:complete